MSKSPRTHRMLALSIMGAVTATICFQSQTVDADTAVFAVAGTDAYIITATTDGNNNFTWVYNLAVPVYLPQFNSAWGTLTSADLATATNLEGLLHTNVPSNGYLIWRTWVSIYDAGLTPSTDDPEGAYAGTNTTITAYPTQSGDQFYYLPNPDATSSWVTSQSIGTGNATGTGFLGYQVSFYAEQTDSSLTGSGWQQDVMVDGYGMALTYTYTPPTSGPGGGGGPNLVGSGGGGWVITSQPTGGWGDLIIASNGVLTIASGNTVAATSITNYGILNQTGGSLTLSGNLNQIQNFYSDTNGTTKGVYNLSGGTASFGGITGNGFVNISGGTLTATTVNHTGVITQTGGTFNSTTFTQTGTQYLDASGSVAIGGSYTLSSGTASLGAVTNNGLIVQSGGTLSGTTLSQTDSVYADISTGALSHFGLFHMTSGTAEFTTSVSGSGTIQIDAGATFYAHNLQQGTVQIGGTVGLLSVSSPTAADIGSLSIGISGLLDVTNNDLIIRGGLTLTQVQSLIDSGSDGGAWDGTTGITSSTALADGATLIADTASGWGVTTLDGIAVASTDILVEYTYFSRPMMNANVTTSSVPEPGSLTVLGIGAIALLKRRP